MEAVKIADAFENESYSIAYLNRRFPQETGITFPSFPKHTRIDASCRLLANTDRSVPELACLRLRIGGVSTPCRIRQ